MPALLWKSFALPENDREYRALLTYLPLKRWRAIPKFMRYTSQIRRQLADSEGLIGYALDAKVLSRDFWTLSVWEDEASLRRFVQQNPHGKVMMDLLPQWARRRSSRLRWMPPPFRRIGKTLSDACESDRGLLSRIFATYRRNMHLAREDGY
jgi:hypothetical protein